jgi:hypothetical protein
VVRERRVGTAAEQELVRGRVRVSDRVGIRGRVRVRVRV